MSQHYLYQYISDQPAKDDALVIDVRARAKFPDAKALAAMPIQRKALLNPSPPFYASPYKSDRKSYNEAANAQIVGIVQETACTHCRDDENRNPGWGTGRFMGCVVAEKADGAKFFNGACASCRFDDHPEKCSFVVDHGKAGATKKQKRVKKDEGDDEYIPGN